MDMRQQAAMGAWPVRSSDAGVWLLLHKDIPLPQPCAVALLVQCVQPSELYRCCNSWQQRFLGSF